MDLVAINTQRGRDHGLPGYIHYRRICKVGQANSFDDLENNMSKDVCLEFKISLKRKGDKDFKRNFLIAIAFTEHQET